MATGSQSRAAQTLSVLAAEAVTEGLAIQPTGFLATSGGRTAGICRRTVPSGAYTIYDNLGTTKATTGQAITAGASLQVGANSKLIPQHSTNPVVARAIEAATAADQVIEVLIVPN